VSNLTYEALRSVIHECAALARPEYVVSDYAPEGVVLKTQANLIMHSTAAEILLRDTRMAPEWPAIQRALDTHLERQEAW
jgi:hypothetical protein